MGVIVIMADKDSNIEYMNKVLSQFSSMIKGRMGLPFPEQSTHIISLIAEGTNDEFGAFSGKIGAIKGIKVKSVLTK